MNRRLQRRMSMSRRILNRPLRGAEMPPKFDLAKAVAKTKPQPEPAITGPLQSGVADAMQQSGEIQALTNRLAPEVKKLTVKTAEDYLEADALLGRIRQARKFWGGIWERIHEKTIKPITQGVNELHKLNRDVDRPLESLEQTVKHEMDSYKAEERRQLLEVEARRLAEEQRLIREAADAARRAEQAKTPQLRGRFTAQAERLEAQAKTVSQEESAAPVQGAFSVTRKTPIWEVSDLTALAIGIAEGSIPADAIMVNGTYINRVFKDSPETVASWPGVTVSEKERTVGR